MNVLSVFDGISSGQLALQKAGVSYNNYFASEIDANAIKVTQTNFPNTIQLGDITKISGKDLPKIDLLLGGSPCQGFSFCGKQLNFEDPRSKLFFEFVRLLKETSPTYFLLENVRMKKEYQDVISKELGIEPIVINSSLFSAQNRYRLYWTNIPNITQPEDKGLKLTDIINGSIINGAAKRTRYTGHETNPTFTKTEIRKDGKANAQLTSERHRLVSIDDNLRKFTPEEVEQLQTVPIGYTSCISNHQRYKCLGNGWTVDVIVHILKNLKS